MRAELTPELLDQLGAEQCEVLDSDLDGFGVRVTAAGAAVFFVRYRTGGRRGRRRRVTLGRYRSREGLPLVSVAKARSAARKILARVELGADPQGERRRKAGAMNVGELAEAYLQGIAGLSSAKDRRRMAESDIVPVLGANSAVEDIDRAAVSAVLDRVIKRGALSAAILVRQVLSGMLDVAQERGVVELNVVRAVRMPKALRGVAQRARSRVLSEDELRAVWADAARSWGCAGFATRLLVLTLKRRSEVAGMQAVELQAPWWTIPEERTKARRSDHVYLAPAALSLIEECRARFPHRRHVFPTQRGKDSHIAGAAITTFSDRSSARLGFEWAPHDLRRTATTHLAEMRCPEEVREALLNHAGRSVERRHYNLYAYDREKREWLLAWARRLEAILAGDAEKVSNVVRIG